MRKIYLQFLFLIISGFVYSQPIVVKDFKYGAFTNELTDVNGTLYFHIFGTLWKSNGTEASTVALKTIASTATGGGDIRFLTNVNGTLYFTGYDDEKNEASVWKSNGTTETTVPVKTFTGTLDYISDITSIGNTVYFGHDDKFYKSDGTEAGTILIKDLNPTGEGGHIILKAFQNKVFISLLTKVQGGHFELWQSNGSNAGTTFIRTFQSLGFVTDAGNFLYMIADDGTTGKELWKTDISGNVSLVKDIIPGSQAAFLNVFSFAVSLNNQLIFGADSGLWKTDGTSSGTIKISSTGISAIVANGQTAYFISNGFGKTDGTESGTTIIKNISDVKELTVVGNSIFFTSGFEELWQSDGTTLGTTLIKNFKSENSNIYGDEFELENVGGILYFTHSTIDITDSEFPIENNILYKYDPGQIWIPGFTVINSETDKEVKILSQGDTLYTDQKITIRADASPPTASVKFYINDVLRRTESSKPFALAGDINGDYTEWTKTKGNYKITAIPFGTNGVQGKSLSYNFVVVDSADAVSNKAPSVSLTAPAQGQSFTAPANITINANASDSDGSITKVEFYQGDIKLGEDLTAPYSFSWNNVAVGNYFLTAVAYDNLNAVTTSSTVNIIVSEGSGCAASGTILREYWANVSGSAVSNIPTQLPPTNTSQLTIFEGPSNVAHNYGSRIRGYICPPITGNYTFWIASNDQSELWLSTNDNPANKIKIAFITGFTNSRQWDKYSSQKSALINLVAGQKYYIEALQKQNGGTDNIAVGWQLPNGTQERPVSGNRLSPFQSSGNNPPTVSITSPANGQTFTAPATITINANATDSDGSISKVEFYQGSTKLSEDNTSPYSFSWTNVGEGNYFFTAIAYDNANASTTSGTVNITVSGGSGCTASGTILREFWNGVSGNSVSNIPTHLPPTSTSQVNIFEGPINAGANYGARYRGYICAPATGNYTFWISSNDDSELWLSTSDNPVSKVKIASVTGYTASREWTKYASQKSALINLTAGQRYYIEALHKQGAGSDNVAIGWQLSNGTLERPIPGSRLSPVESPASFSDPVRLMSDSELENEIPIEVKVYPNPTQKGMVTLSIEGYEQTKHKVYINILNMAGNTVYSDKASCEITCRRTILNIDERFMPGMYIVNVTIDNKIYSERLIVE